MPERSIVADKGDLRVCSNCGVVYSIKPSPDVCPVCREPGKQALDL